MKKVNVIAVPAENGRGWHFATPGILRPGRLNKSLRVWATEKEALAAGRKEYGGRAK